MNRTLKTGHTVWVSWLISLAMGGQVHAQVLPTNRPQLLQASTHPIKYYLALPERYRHGPDQRWSVLLCVDGARCCFAELAQDFQAQRGNLPFLLVVPCTFSNTNAIAGEIRDRYLQIYTEAIIDGVGDRREWDEASLQAILQDLRERYGAAERIYMTGFSGGGLLTYRMIGRRPEMLAGAILVGANYFGDPFLAGPSAARTETPDFPIYQILGEDDPLRYPASRFPFTVMQAMAILIGLGASLAYVVGKRTKRPWPAVGTFVLAVGLGTWFTIAWKHPGLDDQNELAARQLAARGHRSVRRMVVEGLGHNAVPEQVFSILRPLVAAEQARNLPAAPVASPDVRP